MSPKSSQRCVEICGNLNIVAIDFNSNLRKLWTPNVAQGAVCERGYFVERPDLQTAGDIPSFQCPGWILRSRISFRHRFTGSLVYKDLSLVTCASSPILAWTPASMGGILDRLAFSTMIENLSVVSTWTMHHCNKCAHLERRSFK